MGYFLPSGWGFLISVFSFFSLRVDEGTSIYLPRTKLSIRKYLFSIQDRVCLYSVRILATFFPSLVRFRVLSLSFSVRVGMIQWFLWDVMVMIAPAGLMRMFFTSVIMRCVISITVLNGRCFLALNYILYIVIEWGWPMNGWRSPPGRSLDLFIFDIR